MFIKPCQAKGSGQKGRDWQLRTLMRAGSYSCTAVENGFLAAHLAGSLRSESLSLRSLSRSRSRLSLLRRSLSLLLLLPRSALLSASLSRLLLRLLPLYLSFSLSLHPRVHARLCCSGGRRCRMHQAQSQSRTRISGLIHLGFNRT